MSAWLKKWGLLLLGAVALLLPGAGALLYVRGRSKGRDAATKDQMAAADHVELEIAKHDAKAEALAAIKIEEIDERFEQDLPHAGADLENIFAETNARERKK